MSEIRQTLHEIADPHKTLPDVHLNLYARDGQDDIYNVSSGGEDVGSIKLGRLDQGAPFVIHNSFIEQNKRGRGYGFAMYLGAAALAYDSGFRLSSDTLVSRDAAQVWIRLQNRGLARIDQPFQWRAGKESSEVGRAGFVSPDQLESLRPQPQQVNDLDDLWRDA